MPAFTFDPSKSTDQNLAEFFEHLKAVDAESTTLLEQHIHLMLPLQQGQARSVARQDFYAAIKAGLTRLDAEGVSQ